MKKSLIKIISILLISVLFLTFLTACKNDGNNGGISDEKNEVNGGGEQKTEENDVPENAGINYYTNIPEGLNFNGAAFTFLTYEGDSWDTYVDIEDFNGDVLNDAAYTRNLEVEELFGVEFSTIKMGWENIAGAIKKNNAAGDNSYDLVLFFANTSPSSLIMDNLLYDWNKLPYVNTKAEWYNQSANDSFTIQAKQYLAVSDISYTIQQHWRYLFNKELCKTLGLDYPYQLVYDGKWTHDALLGYIKNASLDLNGDGKMDADDRYGLVINQHHIGRKIKAWGEMPVTITPDGFELNIFSDRISDMFDKLIELSKNPDVLPISLWTRDHMLFNQGSWLFNVFTTDPNLLRAVEVDFGYLPYPKYDEQQKNYITVATGGFMCVPGNKTDEDAERVGAVIEALSGASNKYIKDAFVTSYFENKILRDEDSVNMFRLMRDEMFYDVSPFFDTTGLLDPIIPYYSDLILQGRDLASKYESVNAKIEAALGKMWDSIIENQ